MSSGHEQYSQCVCVYGWKFTVFDLAPGMARLTMSWKETSSILQQMEDRLDTKTHSIEIDTARFGWRDQGHPNLAALSEHSRYANTVTYTHTHTLRILFMS